MAEDRVDVRFGAQTGDLRSGIQNALNILEHGFGGIQNAIAGATGAFLGFEIGKEIIEKVASAIERLTEGTAEFDIKISQLSQKLGVSTEDATILSDALGTVGLTTDQYTAVLFKLERQVSTNEGKLRALGVATRDHNGELLKGDELLKSAIARMQDFRAGTDQNAFALQVFGRSAEQVYQLMLLNNEAMDRGREIAKEYGFVSKENVENAHSFHEAVGTLITIFDAWVANVGNAIIPSFTNIINKIIELTPLFKVLGTALEALVVVVDTVVTGLAEVFDLILATIKTAVAGVEGLSNTLSAILSGDMDAVRKSFQDTGNQVDAIWQNTFSSIAKEGVGWAARMQGILNSVLGVQGAPGAAAGGAQSFVDPKAAAEAQKEFDKWLKDLETDLKKASDLKKAAQISDIATTREGSLADLDVQKEAIDRAAALGEISDNEKLARLRDLADKEFQINLDSLNATLNLDALGAQARERIELQLLQLKRQHAAELARLDTQAAVASRAAWTSIVQPIRNAFQQMFTGILQGTQTLRDAMRNLLQNIALSFAQMAAQSLVTWIRTEVAKTEATTIAAAARGAAESEGSKKGLLAHIEDAIKSIMTDAAKTYAAVFAWAAPFMGPFAVIPAVAATALVIGAETLIPAAEHGYDVPRDTLAYLHKDEQVLPADLSRGYKDMIRNGGPSGGGPVNINVSATFSGDFSEGQILRHSKTIAKAVANELRNFSPHLKPT